MAYFQIAILTIVGIVVFGVFIGYFIDLNKDATFQNRRQKKMKPRLRMVKKRKKAHQMPKERGRGENPARGTRSPEKRR